MHRLAGGAGRGERRLVSAVEPAGEVDAHMGDRAVVLGGLGAEQVVERGDPVGLGRGDLELVARVLESARTDPPRLAVQGVQDRQQEVAPLVATAGAAAHEPFVLDLDRSTERGDDRVDGGPFGGGGDQAAQVQVSHGTPR